MPRVFHRLKGGISGILSERDKVRLGAKDMELPCSESARVRSSRPGII
jgi:hypothetical protein